MSTKILSSRPQFRAAVIAVVALTLCASAAQTGAVAEVRLAAVASSLSADVDPAEPAVVELDLTGIDDGAKDELETIAQAQPDQAPVTDPESSPALTTEDPLGVLSDDSNPDVLTERLGVEPFSVMGVTWDLDPSLEGVVVQYRVFQAGGWSQWAWGAPSEEYVEVNGSAPTRGATDAIFVPDSTGVQVLVSSTNGAATGVKIVLIDPGTGPDGTGASTGSGEPTDAVAAPGSTSSAPAPAPTEEPGTQTPEPSPSATPAPADEPEAVTPTVPPTPTPTATPTPTEQETTSSAPEGSVGTAATVSSTVTTVSSPSTAVASPLRMAATAKPGIVTRAVWGASQPVCTADHASSTLAAAVHHTASTNSYTAAQVPALLRGFAAYHMLPEAQGGRGWCDIGYNFLVDKFGTIYEGRAASIDEPIVGVHTGGFNSRTIGVAAIGNYQDAVPSAALAESISQIIAWKFAQNGILANTSVTMISGGGASKYPEGAAVTFSTIYGHRDAQYTSCPGQYLYAALGDIRNRVAALSNQTVSESPRGSWDSVQGGGNSLRVTGWALDPDAGSPVQVQVIVDGSVATTTTANHTRSDVGARGYDATVPASVGPHTVCLRLLNQGGGSDVHLGCRSATSTASSPTGVIDAVEATASSIRVRGWARDPDSTSPISVHIYVDGRAVAAVAADLARPDVQAAAPGVAGPAHGFDRTVTAATGRHTVCIYGINVGGGSNSLIGCRDAVVQNKLPIGSLDLVAAVSANSIKVRGWVLDPDTTSSITTHIYVDGRLATGLLASGDRPDVARVHGRGAAHGFTTDVVVAAGKHEVCIYAIDSAQGPNPRIGCASVTVTNQPPKGVVDAVSGGVGSVAVRGWAFDPDTSAPIAVHVYVNGRLAGAVLAQGARPDVARVFGTGGAHGFTSSFAVPAGSSTVCVYAINAPGGSNPRIGCSQVSVQ
ncbi:N-acetylmuramoyl-L-alanine amidase [Sanguibacter gelidistatuariae]|uniref:N-acetylmuramoyl-L-alanine amidase n=1 Tax=Sanguibacter gelidistatuariae TaxID=1814289 RepID=A0A1G6XWJ6_9MICO|nr:peptidoglycan recognition protein [Sanguibacter gelidistatuariae]SDD82402.1 N-acetylmuramoyl-L-alanine amidase [Sanguibacter gelidistatuariae]